MSIKTSSASRVHRHFIQRASAFVRWQSTAKPAGPYCTVIGHRMTEYSYARAAANPVSAANSKGGSGSESAKREAYAARKNNIGSHVEAALRSGSKNTVNTVDRSDLPSRYPPEFFPPLIVSLWLDDPLQAHISDLRAKHFPSERSYLQGHITLFHALQSVYLDDIMKTINSLCADTPEFEISCEPYELSKNAAVFIPLNAQPLISVRTKLLGTFRKAFNMTNQDVRPDFWPHATVVNKVTREEAEKIFNELKSMPEEDRITHGRAKGLDVWFYRGGPWEHLHRIPFGKS